MTYPVHNSSAAVLSLVCQLLATLVSVSPHFRLMNFKFTVPYFNYVVEYDGNRHKKALRLGVVFSLSLLAMIGRQIAYKEATIAAALSIINFKGMSEYVTTLKDRFQAESGETSSIPDEGSDIAKLRKSVEAEMKKGFKALRNNIEADREKGLVSLGLANYVCAISDALQIGWNGKYACNYPNHQDLGTLTLLALVSSFHLQLLLLAAGHEIVNKDKGGAVDSLLLGLAKSTVEVGTRFAQQWKKSDSSAQSGVEMSNAVENLAADQNLQDNLVENSHINVDQATVASSLFQTCISGSDSETNHKLSVDAEDIRRSFTMNEFLLSDDAKKTKWKLDDLEKDLAGFIVDFFGYTLHITLCICIVFIFVASFRLHYLLDTKHCHKFCYGCHYSAVALGGLDLFLILLESRRFNSQMFDTDEKLIEASWECTLFVWLHGIIVCTAVALNAWGLLSS